MEIDYYVNENGCHVCTISSCTEDGYKIIKRNGKRWLVHRYIYTIYFGDINDGLVVRHKCDNPSCINPKHLELGTIQENINDREERKRTAKGETHGRAKLTKEQVNEIRANNSLTQMQLAKKYNVCQMTISRIKRNILWNE